MVLQSLFPLFMQRIIRRSINGSNRVLGGSEGLSDSDLRKTPIETLVSPTEELVLVLLDLSSKATQELSFPLDLLLVFLVCNRLPK
jgi:hypothetical protein